MVAGCFAVMCDAAASVVILCCVALLFCFVDVNCCSLFNNINNGIVIIITISLSTTSITASSLSNTSITASFIFLTADHDHIYQQHASIING